MKRCPLRMRVRLLVKGQRPAPLTQAEQEGSWSTSGGVTALRSRNLPSRWQKQNRVLGSCGYSYAYITAYKSSIVLIRTKGRGVAVKIKVSSRFLAWKKNAVFISESYFSFSSLSMSMMERLASVHHITRWQLILPRSPTNLGVFWPYMSWLCHHLLRPLCLSSSAYLVCC